MSRNRYRHKRRNHGNYAKNRNNRSRFSRKRNRSRNFEKKSTVSPHKYINKAIPAKQKDQPYERTDFTDIDLYPILKNNIKKKGYKNMTPVQAKVIPWIIDGKNVLGISETGSGKTGAFLIPMVNKILGDQGQRLLIITPTRELAMQIQKEARGLINGTFIRAERVIGGESIKKQSQYLKNNPNIIIGTPGRIMDMQKRGFLNLKSINNLVLDEVDRMLDMGFVNDIRDIFRLLSIKKQLMCFSATINNSIKKIISTMADQYETLMLEGNEPAKNVRQDIIEFSSRTEKIDKLHEMLIRSEVTKTLVFIETKRYVDKVEKELKSRGFKTAALHGDKTQNRRKRVLQQYRENKIQILVATDVAARGLDITDISHVINYDEPKNYDDYIHRIGRTGRNGNLGNALTFVYKGK